MASLEKAYLQEIDEKGKPVSSTDADGKPVNNDLPVQFNPQSLKLELSTQMEGGDSKGRQARQFLGKTSTTLTFDLQFDTADEADANGDPVSVRTKTALVERFVLPKKQAKGDTSQKPPKCRFHWNDLVFDGVIESLSIDFSLFAANGTPLRAKMGVSIKEQDAKYEAMLAELAAKENSSATAPGGGNNGPGGGAGGPTNSSAQALAGESAADFAVRMGLDPGAWRGIAAQLGAGSSLSLQAGLSIDFSSNLSASVGIGFSAGIEADAGLSLGASFGLDGNASFSASAGTSAGFALSSAGGLSAALETTAIIQADSAAADARRAFGPAVPSASPPRPPSVNLADGGTAVGAASIPKASTAAIHSPIGLPPVAITPKPALPEQTRTPMQLTGAATPSLRNPAPSAPPPPLADPRSTSFGRGVPLRPRVGGAADLRAGVSAGRVPLNPQAAVSGLFASSDPSAPPWLRLPQNPGRDSADQAQAARSPARPCCCK